MRQHCGRHVLQAILALDPAEKSPITTSLKPHPEVLHIGFSKCASTYLRSLFRAHPKIHLVFKSGFFTPFLAKDMSFAQYQSLFKDGGKLNVESDEHLTLPGIHPELGVRCTSLDQFREVADKIKAFLPDVKIIMVIRNQASLIVSRYSEFLITGGSLNFEEFASKLAGGPVRENCHYQNYYSEVIGILEERFPRENLLVLLQEAMREDTEQTTSAISRFLSLGEPLQLKKGLRSERQSLSFAGMKMLRRLNVHLVRRPSVGSKPPTTRVPLFIYQNVVRAVRAIDFYLLSHFSPGPSEVLTETRRSAIQAHFKNDNLKLQEYFGRDLGALGYLVEKPQ